MRIERKGEIPNVYDNIFLSDLMRENVAMGCSDFRLCLLCCGLAVKAI